MAFLVAGFALFRDGIFIHEIAHLRSGELRAFRIGWNVIFGITSLTPSFMYSNHADHHKRDTYGTRQDGEYLPLGNGPRRQLVAYFLQVPALPFLALVRFMILTPLSLLHPRMRRWVLERASSYAISPWYRRTLRVGERRGLWIVTELVIFVGLTTLALLVANGTLRWQLIAKFYFLATFGIGLNWIRNTGAHRYRNRGGKLSYDAQLADSINVVGPRPLVDLMFPIGLRYHALHHLFPTLPYHALDEAHRRLMARLPADSPYRKTVQPSYFAAVTELWRGARAFDRQAGSGPAEDGRSSPAR
ncbi:MAG: fatty acid desaturase [Deltaproteobacteria bacterium]